MEAAPPSLAYLRRIWQVRWFWYSLVANDLQTRYRHSWLGIGWSLARPLGLTLIFCLVFGNLFDIPLRDYAPYVLVGLTVWQFIVEAATVGCRSFQTGAAYIRQHAVPLAIFPLRTALGAAFHLAVALGLGLLVTWLFHGFGKPAVLLTLVPSLLLLFFLGWSVATVCGLLQTHFPDTCYILELLLQFAFYLTPVIYRPTTLRGQERFSWLVDCNPLWSVVEMIRQPVVQGQPPALFHVAVSAAFVAAVTLLAILALRRLERTLVFWL
ncbi:MAG: ABC transporter permease [Gemmataceae bacterium]|nr:ABC transporter permease [Gemmataceae bacterium]